MTVKDPNTLESESKVDLKRIRKNIEELLTSFDDNFTLISLFQRIPEAISCSTYFQVLDRLIDQKKLFIEKNGFISWLWNPALFDKLVEKGLFLD